MSIGRCAPSKPRMEIESRSLSALKTVVPVAGRTSDVSSVHVETSAEVAGKGISVLDEVDQTVPSAAE